MMTKHSDSTKQCMCTTYPMSIIYDTLVQPQHWQMVLQWAGLYAGEEWPKLPRLTLKKTHETDREYKGNVTIRILNDSVKGLVVTFTLKCPREFQTKGWFEISIIKRALTKSKKTHQSRQNLAIRSITMCTIQPL